MKKKILIGLSLSLATFIVFTLIGTYIPYYEAKNLKELSHSRSAGNCRIVNTALAIDNGYKTYYINKKGYKDKERHIVAVDNNFTVYDLSRGSNALPNEKIDHYLNKNDFYVYSIIDTLNPHYNYFEENDNNTSLFSSYGNYLYFYLFHKFYVTK